MEVFTFYMMEYNTDLQCVACAAHLYHRVKEHYDDQELCAVACLIIANKAIDDEYKINIEKWINRRKQIKEIRESIVVRLGGKVRPLTAVDFLRGAGKVIATILYIHKPMCYDPEILAAEIKKDLSCLASDFNSITFGDEFAEYISELIDIMDIRTGKLDLPEIDDVEYNNINNSSYIYVCNVWSGSQSRVNKVINYDTMKYYAQKSQSNKNLVEIAILNSYRHENVISLKEFRFTNHGLQMYFELGTSLDEIMNCSFLDHDAWEECYINGNVSRHEIRWDYMSQISKGLAFLHQNYVIHRDIKLENIIVVNKIAKIADFGISFIDVFNKPKNPVVYSVHNRPIELLLGAKDYTFSADIWATGAMFLAMATKVIPFQVTMKPKMEESVLWCINEILPLKLHCIKEPKLRETLLQMLDPIPENRPAIIEL